MSVDLGVPGQGVDAAVGDNKRFSLPGDARSVAKFAGHALSSIKDKLESAGGVLGKGAAAVAKIGGPVISKVGEVLKDDVAPKITSAKDWCWEKFQNTYSTMVPVKDADGKDKLDADGKPVMERKVDPAKLKMIAKVALYAVAIAAAIAAFVIGAGLLVGGLALLATPAAPLGIAIAAGGGTMMAVAVIGAATMAFSSVIPEAKKEEEKKTEDQDKDKVKPPTPPKSEADFAEEKKNTVAKLGEMNSKIEELKHEKSALTEYLQNLPPDAPNYDATEAHLKAVTDELGQLEELRDQAGGGAIYSKNQELEAAKNSRLDCKTAIAGKNAAVTKLEQDCKAKEAEVGQLQARVDGGDNALGLQEQLTNAKREFGILDAKKEAANAELAQLNTKLAEAEGKLKTIDGELNEMYQAAGEKFDAAEKAKANQAGAPPKPADYQIQVGEPNRQIINQKMGALNQDIVNLKAKLEGLKAHHRTIVGDGPEKEAAEAEMTTVARQLQDLENIQHQAAASGILSPRGTNDPGEKQLALAAAQQRQTMANDQLTEKKTAMGDRFTELQSAQAEVKRLEGEAPDQGNAAALLQAQLDVKTKTGQYAQALMQVREQEKTLNEASKEAQSATQELDLAYKAVEERVNKVAKSNASTETPPPSPSGQPAAPSVREKFQVDQVTVEETQQKLDQLKVKQKALSDLVKSPGFAGQEVAEKELTILADQQLKLTELATAKGALDAKQKGFDDQKEIVVRQNAAVERVKHELEQKKQALAHLNSAENLAMYGKAQIDLTSAENQAKEAGAQSKKLEGELYGLYKTVGDKRKAVQSLEERIQPMASLTAGVYQLPGGGEPSIDRTMKSLQLARSEFLKLSVDYQAALAAHSRALAGQGAQPGNAQAGQAEKQAADALYKQLQDKAESINQLAEKYKTEHAAAVV